jgi:hypothetical protein
VFKLLLCMLHALCVWTGPWHWQRLAALDVATQLPPSAAAGLAGVEWTVLDVTPSCGDASLTMQAIVQVGDWSAVCCWGA